jgi:hypothetical protein
VAAGDSVPSSLTVSVAETGVQAPFLRTRTGSTLLEAWYDPSGSAVVMDVGVVMASTVTGRCADRARVDAACIGVGVAGAGEAAWASAALEGNTRAAPASSATVARVAIRRGRADTDVVGSQGCLMAVTVNSEVV